MSNKVKSKGNSSDNELDDSNSDNNSDKNLFGEFESNLKDLNDEKVSGKTADNNKASKGEKRHRLKRHNKTHNYFELEEDIQPVIKANKP